MAHWVRMHVSQLFSDVMVDSN